VIEWCRNYKGEKMMAVLCDPPYEIGFMGKKFDTTGVSFRVETWEAIASVCHPGAFIMAFSSCRTLHRMMVAMEDSGLVLHNCLMAWAFGQGFPKAQRVRDGKQVDTGETETLSDIRSGSMHAGRDTSKTYTRPLMQDKSPFSGHRYGLQALKPALEPIIVAQKPYVGKPVDCITKTGAGALNVDAGRISTNGEDLSSKGDGGALDTCNAGWGFKRMPRDGQLGRWPANFLLCCLPTCTGEAHDPDCPAARLDRQSGELTSGKPCGIRGPDSYGFTSHEGTELTGYGDTGGASRFFFRAKADNQQEEITCKSDKQSEQETPRSACCADTLKPTATTGSTVDASSATSACCPAPTKPMSGDANGSVDPFRAVADAIDDADPVRYVAKASSRERSDGLDSYLTVKYSADQKGNISWQHISRLVSTLLQRATSGSITEASLSIVACGDGLMARCLKDSLSTIRMATSGITDSKILSLLTPSFISESIAAANCETANGGNGATAAESSSPLSAASGTLTSEAIPATDDVARVISGLLSKINDADAWQEWRSSHPTHKPIALAKYLATLLLPPADYAPRRILIPFSGSGSEMAGAMQAGWEEVIGIEADAEYVKIAEARLAYWQARMVEDAAKPEPQPELALA